MSLNRVKGMPLMHFWLRYVVTGCGISFPSLTCIFYVIKDMALLPSILAAVCGNWHQWEQESVQYVSVCTTFIWDLTPLCEELQFDRFPALEFLDMLSG